MQVTIVGNSAAALSALESFRERDQMASVTLVSSEPGPAYSRVLLPYHLLRRLSYDGVFIRQMDDYARLRAATEFSVRVEQVDPARRELQLADGRRLGFDRLLLAIGSSPARSPIPGVGDPGIHTLWKSPPRHSDAAASAALVREKESKGPDPVRARLKAPSSAIIVEAGQRRRRRLPAAPPNHAKRGGT